MMALPVSARQTRTPRSSSHASFSPPLSPSSSEIRTESQAWFTRYVTAHGMSASCSAMLTRRCGVRSTRKIYAEVNYHNDVLELYQRCIDVLEFADIESQLDSPSIIASLSQPYDPVPSAAPSTVSHASAPAPSSVSAAPSSTLGLRYGATHRSAL
jgi:hypothetical protein